MIEGVAGCEGAPLLGELTGQWDCLNLKLVSGRIQVVRSVCLSVEEHAVVQFCGMVSSC